MPIITNSKRAICDPGLNAAREDRDFFRYVDAKTNLDTEAVLTDATFLLQIHPGERSIITSFVMSLNTTGDWLALAFGTTENQDGTGEFTQMTPTLRADSVAGLYMVGPHLLSFNPPISVRRSDGRAFTARVHTNDAAASVTLGYLGWIEKDD